MFTQSAEFYDAIYSFKNYAAEAAQIAARVRSAHPTARRALDVACGTGEHARILAQDHGFDVDGLDVDPALLHIARAKYPSGFFIEADMSDFALDRRYDAVLCLFSSIAYLVTLDRIRRALECFRRHLSPHGIVLVEPWFPPGALDTERVFRQTGTYRGASVERVGHTEIDGRISRLHFDYRIESEHGTREVSEVHELGLFTADEMQKTFEEAGLKAELDPVGIDGRGLWLATTAA